MFKKWRAARAERRTHNDRDYSCRYWTGDHSGSVVGVMWERCPVCRPEASLR